MELTRRNLLVGATAGLAAADQVQAAPGGRSPVTLDPTLFQAILDAGGWSETADDNGGGERLPERVVAAMVQGAGRGAPPQTPHRAWGCWC